MRKRQKGAVLLVLLSMLMLTGATLIVNGLDPGATGQIRAKQTREVLQQAKQALVGFALAYGEQHPGQPQGYLPCPDMDGDGTADGPCGTTGQSVIGRLPWRTLDLPALRDGAGECLWYAVSGRYKNHPKAALTSDSDGMFRLKNRFNRYVIGRTAADRAIAVVMAPGAILARQDRRLDPANRTECGSTSATDAGNQAANYLDRLAGVDNATGMDVSADAARAGGEPIPRSRYPGLDSVFMLAPQVRDQAGNVVFNDALLTITPADYAAVYRRMDTWVGARVAACLQAYAQISDGKYPFAAALDTNGMPEFNDDNGVFFGRIADAPLNASHQFDSSLQAAWQPDSTLPAGVSGIDCFDGSMAPDPNWAWWWWPAWREMVFVAVDKGYLPGSPASQTPQLNLNRIPQRAVVLVAGRRLAGQQRIDDDSKARIKNYLEQQNTSPHDMRFINGPAAPSFNDVVLPVAVTSGAES